MVRTLIAIKDKDKEWLDHYSYQHHQSRAETVRRAIEYFQKNSPKSLYQETLKRTSGLWKNKKIDSLKYVQGLREGWERRFK